VARVAADLDDMHVVEMRAQVLELAVSLASQHPLRAFDAAGFCRGSAARHGALVLREVGGRVVPPAHWDQRAMFLLVSTPPGNDERRPIIPGA
jgi:hypothetical protein